MFTYPLIACLAVIAITQAKPIQDVLPHSKDYYAGYIKAITDNFEQLFSTGDRQIRSTPEDEEQADFLSDDDNAESRSAETLGDVRHYEDSSASKTLTEIKRDVKEDAEPLKKNQSEVTNSNTEAADATKTAEKKDDTPVTDENVVKDEADVTAEKTASTETKPTEEKDTEETESTSTGSSIVKVTGDEDDEKEKEDASEGTHVPGTDTGIADQETPNAAEMEQDEPGNEEASENEEEVPVEFHSNIPAQEGGDDDEDMRRDFILEHANMQNQFAPKIISGYQGMPYGGGQNGAYMFPGPMGFNKQPIGTPFNFGYPQQESNYVQQQDEGPFTGESRSKINQDAKKRDDDDNKGDKTDSHHLHRVLVLPQDCHHGHGCHGCCHDGCHDCCNHCSYPIAHHGSHHIHDIHHWPVGCAEHYSHESPCLTYPHADHVGFGYPCGCQTTHHSCGCHDNCCNHPYHSHHPVILHPTYQEAHHHNIHVTHDNGCHHGCNGGCCHDGCGHVDHVHLGHHGGHCNDHHIAILPHYGHTCAGSHGWNPYWGH